MLRFHGTAHHHRDRTPAAPTFFYLQHSIAANPDAWPDLADLARVACMSRFHFLRRYHASVLETQQATVRRLKLSAARQRLARPRISVTETALEFGYSSPQAFARAYRQMFGVAPGFADRWCRNGACCPGPALTNLSRAWIPAACRAD